jgi:uncharacterized protein DUF2726
MRVKPISTATEALGLGILRRTLSGRWDVAPNVSIQSVLHQEESLSDEAFSMFTRGHFDCVVYRSDNHEPVFAVEFDGFGHDKPSQIERDRLKNLFCMAAGLPLLRLGTADLIQQEQVSVLEWLSRALIDSLDRLDEDDDHELSVSRFEPPREVDEGFDLDEEGPVFESEHPFPGNAAVSDRLLRRYSISVGSALKEPGGLPRIVMDSSSGTSRYVLNVRWPGRRTFEKGPASEFVLAALDFTVHDRNSVIQAGVGRGRFAWAHRLPQQLGLSALVGNEVLSTAQMRHRFEQGLCPTDLGWWEAAGVARELARYDVLTQVERWADREARALKTDVS